MFDNMKRQTRLAFAALGITTCLAGCQQYAKPVLEADLNVIERVNGEYKVFWSWCISQNDGLFEEGDSLSIDPERLHWK